MAPSPPRARCAVARSLPSPTRICCWRSGPTSRARPGLARVIARSYVDGRRKPTRSFLHPSAKRCKPGKPEVRARRLRALCGLSAAGVGSVQATSRAFETASPLSNRRSAFGKDPVRCALMSGLSRGACRWPSWVCACVPGAILGGVLEAQHLARHGLDCLDHSLSHHAVQRFLPDRAGLRPPPTTVRRNVTPLLPQRPRHAPLPGRPPCASSRPRRCAPSCSPAPRSPA
jgi:hypothetical protein